MVRRMKLSKWKAPTVCENASNMGRSIGIQNCFNSAARKRVTIQYSDHGTDQDTLWLCAECAERVKADAEGHGYAVTVTEEIPR